MFSLSLSLSLTHTHTHTHWALLKTAGAPSAFFPEPEPP